MTKLANNKLKSYSYILVTSITLNTLQVAAEDELFTPYAHVSVALDDNVFLQSDEELLNNPIDDQTDAEDTVTEYGAGLRTDITSSSQHYLLSFDAYRRDYSEFDRLNFTGGNINAKWDWYLNKKWDGEISYLFKREQSNLGDQRLINGDVYDLNQAKIKAIRHTSANNEIYIAAIFRNKEYEERQNLDNDQTNIALGYKYISPKNNSIALELRGAEGESSNSSNLLTSLPTLTNYEQGSINVITGWKTSAGDNLKFEIGYVTRDHDAQFNEFDYNGVVLEFDHLWKIANRTQLKWGFGRKLNNTENTVTLFTKEDFGFINAEWAATQSCLLYTSDAADE